MSPITTIAPLLKEAEVAKQLNLEISTLRRWRWAGKGPPFVKLHSAVRYRVEDLAAFVEKGRRLSTADSSSMVE